MIIYIYIYLYIYIYKYIGPISSSLIPYASLFSCDVYEEMTWICLLSSPLLPSPLGVSPSADNNVLICIIHPAWSSHAFVSFYLESPNQCIIRDSINRHSLSVCLFLSVSLYLSLFLSVSLCFCLSVSVCLCIWVIFSFLCFLCGR